MVIRRGASKQRQDQRDRAHPPSPAGKPAAWVKKPVAPPPGTVRLQRVMADAGVASRRVCEEMIEGGRVEVNGKIASVLPVFVDPQRDRITVEGRPLARQKDTRGGPAATGTRRLYVMLNKTGRTVTTTQDEAGRKTVLDLVKHPSGSRLYPVGRLGFETTGLLLLTNDGELANRLTHARYGVPKTYRAEVKGEMDEAALHRLEREAFRSERRARKVEAKEAAAVVAEGPKVPTGRVKLSIIRREAGKTIVEVTLAEGKNRQVERVLGEAGWPVKKLACTAVGPIELSGIAPGEWRELDREEIRALRKAAGLATGGAARGGTAGAARAKRRPAPVDGARKRTERRR
jgi:23S rRNA pseudouridine2605 synthase